MVMSAQRVSFDEYAKDKMELRYSHVVGGVYESWHDICKRVCQNVMSVAKVPDDIYDALYMYMVKRKFIPGGRILSQAGRAYHQTDNCFTLRADDTREGWAELAHKCTMMFMSGGGVGVDYSHIRPYGVPLSRSGGVASGPLPLIEMVDGIAAAVRQGGERRGACYASLPWWHDDVQKFIQMKVDDNKLKHTNISVMFDDISLSNNPDNYYPASDIFMDTLKNACKYGDPGFQFDPDNQTLRNACTEIISSDDSDSCCIGSINFAAIDNLQELAEVVNLAILFLLCNTLYTDFPTSKVRQVKEQNRRLGLGIMGIGEWFIQRSLPYGDVNDYESDKRVSHIPPKEHQIGQWLHIWERASIIAAREWSDRLYVEMPVATRAIAPTGTISIVGGHTTPGIEPVFHTAYIRTSNTLKTREYSDGYKREVVIDPIVEKWIEQGYDVGDIDTAYTLSQSIEGIERRIKFQAYVQQFVDNGISSTVNLPPYTPGIEESIAPILLNYLPQLRGITFYPDGARDHQPVVPIDIGDALAMDGVQIQESDGCKGGECGL